MNTYVVLLRGINVGGKNKVSMAELKKCLEELGFSRVVTYIASGNVLLQSSKPAGEIKTQIEAILPGAFKLDSELIKVLVLTREQFEAIISHKPKGFGEQPQKYHSDAIFLMEIDAAEAMPIFNPREGVDKIWAGKGVIYSQRLSAERTKSRLSAMMISPLYRSMTIRSWNTTLKLMAMLRDTDASNKEGYMTKMTIEVIFVPVTDVDRAKDFYVNKLGFNPDHDQTVRKGLRFVQLTPQGSACSIAIGEGITEMKPGTQQSIMMVVDDVTAVQKDLKEKGVDITDLDKQAWGTFAYFKDPDGNGWTLQELPYKRKE